MKLIYGSLAVLLFTLTSCSSTTKPTENKTATSKEVTRTVDLDNTNLKKAYFASGCFWCVEAIYESVKGVKESISGYSGGHTQNPTYEASNTGNTGHAEAVEIIYDPSVVSFKTLVDVYFGSQNITQVNGQGNDRGSQYRSIIFYQNEEQKQIITDKIASINKEIAPKKVAAEVMKFDKFWLGEDYHQDYEKKHPDHPYIKAVSIPRLKKFQAKFPDLIKDNH
jgi:peptide-methionine (S)-S-oxide reductase